MKPNTDHWYFKTAETKDNFDLGFRINDPVKMIVSGDKKTVTIRSYFLKTLENVILSITDGKDDMPIYQFDKIEPFKEYILEVPVEAYTSISKSFTFDKAFYRLLNLENEDLKKIKALNVAWNVEFDNKITVDYAKKLIIELTMYGSVLSSKTFDILMDNYTSVVGKAFPQYNLSTEKSKVYKLLGLEKTDTWGRAYRNPRKQAKSLTKCVQFTTVHATYSGAAWCAGFRWGCAQHDATVYQLGLRPGEITCINKQTPITGRFAHEFGHSQGCNHEGLFTYAPLNDVAPFIIPVLGSIMAPDFAYYDLLPEDNSIRIGYTNTEVWMYNHKDLFDQKLIDRIVEKRSQRNDKFNQLKAQSWLTSLVWIKNNANNFDKTNIYNLIGKTNAFKSL